MASPLPVQQMNCSAVIVPSPVFSSPIVLPHSSFMPPLAHPVYPQQPPPAQPSLQHHQHHFFQVTGSPPAAGKAPLLPGVTPVCFKPRSRCRPRGSLAARRRQPSSTRPTWLRRAPWDTCPNSSSTAISSPRAATSQTCGTCSPPLRRPAWDGRTANKRQNSEGNPRRQAAGR